MLFLLALLSVLQVESENTLIIRTVNLAPLPGDVIDSARYGPPQVRIPTRQGPALVWLLRASDTVFVAANIADSTPSWHDDLVLSIDIKGDGGPSPQHDDFQLDFRRVLDSSVVYRGRNGRWQPPQDNPDWRLGSGRSGGGWEVGGREDGRSWNLILRLDPAWLEGNEGRLTRMAFRIYDDSPSGWFSWPRPRGAAPTEVEQVPDQWAPVR